MYPPRDKICKKSPIAPYWTGGLDSMKFNGYAARDQSRAARALSPFAIKWDGRARRSGGYESPSTSKSCPALPDDQARRPRVGDPPQLAGNTDVCSATAILSN